MDKKSYLVFTCKTYVVNGETKKNWYKVGYVRQTANGGLYLTLFERPEAVFHIFADKEAV